MACKRIPDVLARSPHSAWTASRFPPAHRRTLKARAWADRQMPDQGPENWSKGPPDAFTVLAQRNYERVRQLVWQKYGVHSAADLDLQKSDSMSTQTPPKLPKSDSMSTQTPPNLQKSDSMPTQTLPDLQKSDSMPTQTLPKLQKSDSMPTQTSPNLMQKSDSMPTQTLPKLQKSDSMPTQISPNWMQKLDSMLNTARSQTPPKLKGTQKCGYATEVDIHQPIRAYPDFKGDIQHTSAYPEFKGDIHHHLQAWQEHHNQTSGQPIVEIEFGPSDAGGVANVFDQGCDSQLSSVHIVDHEPLVDSRSPAAAIEAGETFQPGDLVEHKFLSEPMVSVFVRSVNRGRALCYTDRGSWVIVPPSRPLFAVPCFIDPDDLSVLLPYARYSYDTELALLDVPRSVGAPLLARMQAFRSVSRGVYRENASRLDNLVDLLAPDHYADGLREIHLTDAAEILLQKPVEDLSPEMLFTVHKQLVKSPNIVLNPYTHRRDPVFTVFDKRSSRSITKVRSWLRDYLVRAGDRRSMETFIAKARETVLQSRKSRQVSPSGFLGPLSMPVKESQERHWNAGERHILHYLNAWVAAQSVKNGDLAAVGPMLLRATGLYEDRVLDCSTGYTFLQELGCVAPWHDSRLYDPTLNLCGYSEATPITKMSQAADNAAAVWFPVDRFAAQRKDWGTLPVYCIDSADTQERDDGISIEQRDQQTWVHVHVANPSAFLDPHSAMMHFAAKMGQSLYLPTFKQSMMPSLGLSLAPNSPCLTFSACLDEYGNLIEHQVSHGRIHDVHFLTPEILAQQLDNDHRPLTTSTLLLQVGKSPASRATSKDSPLLEDDMTNLRKLREISQRNSMRRRRNGALDIQRSFDAEQKSRGKCMAEVHFPRQDQPLFMSTRARRVYDFDPSISVVSRERRSNDVDDLVSGLMILAGEVCARWCVERAIAIPYRGMRPNPSPAFNPQVLESRMRDQNPSVDDIRAYMQARGYSDLSTQPLEHFALGLSCYSQATSPLRRFSDMLTHWQIEGHVSGTWLFDEKQIAQQCRHLTVRSSQARFVESRANNLWCLQALFRAFYFQEAPLPELFDVLVTRNDVTNRFVHGRLLGWGLPVYMNKVTAIDIAAVAAQPADVWKARLERVDLYSLRVVLCPVRR